MYTVVEAAKTLRVDPSYIRYLIRSGKLKGVKWGRDWMIPALDYQRKRRQRGLTGQANNEDFHDENTASDGMDIFNLFSKETPIFEGVDTRELLILAQGSNRLNFVKNQTIVMKEDKANFFYIVEDGLVKISTISPSGRELIIDILNRGNAFGIGSLISDYMYPDEISAMENATIISIPKNLFKAFISRNSEVSAKMFANLITQTIALLAKVTDMSTSTTNFRVIKVLIELMNKYGNVLPFTHKEIAQMSGTTNETATRILVRLKKAGILRLQRGIIRITDAKRLLLQSA